MSGNLASVCAYLGQSLSALSLERHQSERQTGTMKDGETDGRTDNEKATKERGRKKDKEKEGCKDNERDRQRRIETN